MRSASVAPRSGNEPANAADEELAVEQDRDREQDREQRGRDAVGDRAGRVLDRLGVGAQVLRARRSATAAPSPTPWPRAARARSIGSRPRSFTVCGICLLKSRTSWIVGTVINAREDRGDDRGRHQHDHGGRAGAASRYGASSASTNGLSANASNAAIASDESVRGIERMNHTAIANSATAMASGIAERGSRSMPPVGRRVGRSGRGSDGRRRHVGIVRADGRHGAHAPGAAVGSLRARARLRAGPHVLVPRDRARRGAGHRVGAVGDGDRRARLSRGAVARALPLHSPARSRCSSPRS